MPQYAKANVTKHERDRAMRRDSYVANVLLKRSARLVKAAPQTVAAYTGNNSLPVDVAMRGLPDQHDTPVFDRGQCGAYLQAERPFIVR